MNWKTEKPKRWRECILLTASLIDGQGWSYSLFEVQKTECDGKWYWGLFCDDGDEWGDIEDLKADLYATIRPLKTKE